jgi:hypothetical protein
MLLNHAFGNSLASPGARADCGRYAAKTIHPSYARDEDSEAYWPVMRRDDTIAADADFGQTWRGNRSLPDLLSPRNFDWDCRSFNMATVLLGRDRRLQR